MAAQIPHLDLPAQPNTVHESKSWSHGSAHGPTLGFSGPSERELARAFIAKSPTLREFTETTSQLRGARSWSFAHTPVWTFLYDTEQSQYFSTRLAKRQGQTTPRDLCIICSSLNLQKIREIDNEILGDEGMELCSFVGLSTSMANIPCALCRGLASILSTHPGARSPETRVAGKLIILPASYLSGLRSSIPYRSTIIGVSLDINPVKWDAVARCTTELQGLLVPVIPSSIKQNPPFCYGIPLGPHVEFGRLRKMLSLCAQNHRNCQTPTHDFPTQARVIDCKARRVVPLSKSRRYFALSYVWGSSSARDSLIMNSHTTDGRLPESLPQTIEDAIEVTLKLGLSYLWCDRYCIEQYHSDDKKHQINQMASIYNRAVATICALGPDDNSGLPGVSGERRPLPVIDIRGASFSVCPAPVLLKDHVSISKWSSRGWTFQEGLLSRRCIFFAPEQAHLVCCASSQDEAILQATQLSTGKNFHGATSNIFSTILDRELRWFRGMHGQLKFYDYVQHYLQRRFTIDEDTFPAFKGILSMLENQSYYGVPIFDFSDNRSAEQDDLILAKRFGFAHGLLWEMDETKFLSARRTSLPSWTCLAHTFSRPRLASLDHAQSSAKNDLGLACVSSALLDQSYVAQIAVLTDENVGIDVGVYLQDNIKHKIVKELTPAIEVTSVWAKVTIKRADPNETKLTKGHFLKCSLSPSGNEKGLFSMTVSNNDVRSDTGDDYRNRFDGFAVLLLTEKYTDMPDMRIYRFLQLSYLRPAASIYGSDIYNRVGLLTFREVTTAGDVDKCPIGRMIEENKDDTRGFRIE